MKRDFFISYNHKDEEAARWIAWHLEKAGYSTIIQAWDFLPGNNFVEKMDNALKTCRSTIAVLSDNYLQSGFTKAEWQAAFAKDPIGEKRLLIPIRIQKCDLTGILGQIIYIDLVGLKEEEAIKKLLEGVRESPLKPVEKPPFKGFETHSISGINRDEILEKRKIELNEVLEKNIQHNYHMILKLEEEIEKEIEVKNEVTGKIKKRKELVWEEVELEKILADNNNYILINPSGMGKTTFLTYLACTLLGSDNGYKFLPFSTTCINLNKRGTAISINDFIQKNLESVYYNSKTSLISNEWECLCIFMDALDQAMDLDEIVSSLHIQNQYSNYKKAKIIISSRQNTADKIREGFNKIRLKLPEDDEVRHYLGEEYYNNIKLLIDSSRELVTVPVLLEMLKIITERGHNLSKIYNRASLYTEFTRVLIDQERNKPRYWQNPSWRNEFINYELEQNMETIAFFSLSNNEILEIGKEKLIEYCDSAEKKETLLNTGIILELFEDRELKLVFRHQSFQAYFAARYIYYRQPRLFPELVGNIAFFYNDVWYEVMRFFVGLENDSQKTEEIIDSIYQTEDKKVDLNQALRLIFSFFLMSEAQVSRKFVQRVYKQIGDLLKNKKQYWNFFNSNTDKFNKANGGQRRNLFIIFKPLLRDKDESFRYVAAEALGKLGTSKDIPLLEPLLRDKDVNSGYFVEYTLSDIVTAEDIPLLEPLLRDKNKYVRKAATIALERIIKAGDIPLIEPLLRDEDGEVRSAAVYALGIIVTAKDIPLLEPLLRDVDWVARCYAADALGKIGSAEHIPLITPLLNDKVSDVRRSAEEALDNIVRVGKIPVLKPLLMDKDYDVCNAAVEALGNMGTIEHIPLLDPIFRRGDMFVCSTAGKALGMIFTAKKISLLLPMLRDADFFVRYAATIALGNIGTSEHIPLLKPLLRDEDENLRYAATEALGKIGTAKDIPLLEPLLSDKYICTTAVEALGKIGTSKDIPLLEPLLRDKESYVRRAVVRALGKIGSSKDIPLLEPLLRDEDKLVRRTATEALGKIGASEHIYLLGPLLRDKDPDIRSTADKALNNIVTAKDIHRLVPLLRDGKWSVRLSVVEALGKIGSSKDIPLLEPLLRDEVEWVRHATAKALGKICTSKDIPLLKRLLRHEDNYVCRIAAETIGKVGTTVDITLIEPRLRYWDYNHRHYAEAIENIYKRSKPELQIIKSKTRKEKKKRVL